MRVDVRSEDSLGHACQDGSWTRTAFRVRPLRLLLCKQGSYENSIKVSDWYEEQKSFKIEQHALRIQTEPWGAKQDFSLYSGHLYNFLGHC